MAGSCGRHRRCFRPKLSRRQKALNRAHAKIDPASALRSRLERILRRYGRSLPAPVPLCSRDS
ncbi:hypothetical protein AMIS_30630 [Actinoplanes missouriensis 431]|uniref:Transposase n=1 Tax=Actinoplanes missouriensis (strain ATCC 14538 / DSM 43046 / CBS 188.64 / JCM 3121 / NBRC 102363 / NCIMB 12654 / NRRL B-3342 / UNCC 431) TaxID=512565 RepID=I0H5J6_ACTM4|nr:hypothetical protein AMIS_30630 [Actinoplanes missouriensis 431]